MSSFNKVILMGNLTRTPELRTIPSGAQVTDITLAINDVFTDKGGQRQERVTFVDITVWGKQAETLCRWKKQGDPLLVEGRLQQDKWQDKETGQNRSKLKVVAVGFQFVGRAGEGGGGGGGGQRQDNRGGQGRRQPPPQDQSNGYEDQGGYDSGYDSGYATNLPPSEDDSVPF